MRTAVRAADRRAARAGAPLLAAAAALAFTASPAAAPAPDPAAAPLLAALAGRTVEGEPWYAERIAGRVVLVEFWATWCPPCLAELPELRALRQAHDHDSFEIVGVAMDTLDRRELRSWLTRHRVSWPQLYDRRGFDGEVARRFGVETVPRSFLFDPCGRLVAVDLPVEALEAAVSALLAIRAADGGTAADGAASDGTAADEAAPACAPAG